MRQRKTVKIDELEVTVKELKVKEILEFGDTFLGRDESGKLKKPDMGVADLLNNLGDNLKIAVEGVDLDGLKDLAPSEIKIIYDAFKEVNAVFFEVAQQAGIPGMLGEAKKVIKADFLKLLADL